MQFSFSSFAKRAWPLAATLALMFALLCAPLASPVARAQDHSDQLATPAAGSESPSEEAVDSAVEPNHEHGKPAVEGSVFEPEHATWFNYLARNIFATPDEKEHMEHAKEEYAALQAKAASGATLSDDEQKELKEGIHYVTKYDWLLYTPLLWALLFLAFWSAARKARIRPEGKAHSLTNSIEWAVESFQDYLIGVMGNDLARRFTPLVASFFFTILAMNWLGLVPGMLSPSTQPAIPIAMAIVGFVAVHVLAIKEAGFKTWIMHFVGEPLWLAGLNFPLHIIGELIKPVSLSLRLLCNVFGEEAVVATLAALAVTFLPIWLPIPFQFPMLVLGTFFGFLQALVFATLLAIYLSIFMAHNDDHGHGEDGHAGEHTEHATESDGDKQIVGHPTALTVGA